MSPYLETGKKNLEDINDREKKYQAVIALSGTPAHLCMDLLGEPTRATNTAAPTYMVCFADLVVNEVFASTTGRLNKPNLPKENLVKQIDSIPVHQDFYDAEEAPPDNDTKDAARRIILGVSPSGLLAGADVYGYYGQVNVCWETQSKKLKLVVFPPANNRQPELYHGQMDGGRVRESDIERNVDSAGLGKWLAWLQG